MGLRQLPAQTQSEHRFEAGVPLGSPEIMVGGVRLAVASEGSGPPVICLHAIGHGGRDFEAFASGVRTGFQVVRIDWPGQGRSGPDSEPPTPARYAQLLRGVVSTLGLGPPIIIGCSIGGAAAIHYAARYPTRAIVLANSGGLVEHTAAICKACLFISRIFAAGARRAWWFGPLFALSYRLILPSRAAWPQRHRIVRAGYETAQTLSQAWAKFAEPTEADQRQAAASLEIPILVAWSMQDKLNLFSAVQPTLKQIKHVRIAQFKGGHAAFLEQPQRFISEYLRFSFDNGLHG
jgi:4,5:9,10-diseco-3-hydroxy-5,9,17-trioxoandrosta-1(10),2-diene-4-oate hydrolase